MGRSICRITFRSSKEDLTILATDLATTSRDSIGRYVPFFDILVPLAPDEDAIDQWGVSREPSKVTFLLNTPSKLTIDVLISNTPPVAWANKVCASRPGLTIKMVHKADEGGDFYLTVTRVVTQEGGVASQEIYSSPYEWMVRPRTDRPQGVDWETFFEESALRGHRFFSKRFQPRLLKWLGEHNLLGVVSSDEIVYDLRAVILDVLSEYNEDFQNAAECWRWLGSVGNLALERLREDVGWADYVETQGRDDYWMYPVKTKDSRLELIAGLALNLECDFPILEATYYA